MTFGTYCRLGVPVWASDRTVIRAARRRLAAAVQRDRRLRAERRRFYAAMLGFHRDAHELARRFRL